MNCFLSTLPTIAFQLSFISANLPSLVFLRGMYLLNATAESLTQKKETISALQRFTE